MNITSVQKMGIECGGIALQSKSTFRSDGDFEMGTNGTDWKLLNSQEANHSIESSRNFEVKWNRISQ